MQHSKHNPLLIVTNLPRLHIVGWSAFAIFYEWLIVKANVFHYGKLETRVFNTNLSCIIFHFTFERFIY